LSDGRSNFFLVKHNGYFNAIAQRVVRRHINAPIIAPISDNTQPPQIIINNVDTPHPIISDLLSLV